MLDLRAEFGDIDIYLFDQLHKGRVPRGARVLDIGCGGGRNLVYLLKQGFDVRACDPSAEAVASVQRLAASLAPGLPASNFRVESLEAMTFEPASADLVICNTVLHFARDDDHFAEMLHCTWRMVAPGGLYFCRLASSIGMADRMQPLGRGRYLMPDGTERFLVDAPMLKAWQSRLGAEALEPIKTTIVDDLRCMTTWVLRKAE